MMLRDTWVKLDWVDAICIRAPEDVLLRGRFCFCLVVQIIKNSPAMQEIWIWSLGWEDPLEKGMATHSSILAWRIPWTEEPGGLQSMGCKELKTTEWLTLLLSLVLESQHHYIISLQHKDPWFSNLSIHWVLVLFEKNSMIELLTQSLQIIFLQPNDI